MGSDASKLQECLLVPSHMVHNQKAKETVTSHRQDEASESAGQRPEPLVLRRLRGPLSWSPESVGLRAWEASCPQLLPGLLTGPRRLTPGQQPEFFPFRALLTSVHAVSLA